MTQTFDRLTELSSEPQPLFDEVARQLVEAGRFHDLFQARLMQGRLKLGIPLERYDALESLPEPLRTETEKAYLEACSEVGRLLLDRGQMREGWMYLRPTGDTGPVEKALAKVVPQDETIEELIDVALHQGVAAERGFGWMLGHYGTCNSITTLEGVAASLKLDDLRACAAILVRHLHHELSENVSGHYEREKHAPPREDTSLGDWVATNPWLFAGEAYHIDTSHLASTVRFSRLVVDPPIVRLAIELAEYGRRLAPALQYPGEEPFVDVYPSSLLLLSATLGERTDEAVRFFRRKAEQVEIEEHGTGAIEAYLILLARLEQHGDALAEAGRLVPGEVTLSPHAPTLLELAKKSGDWETYFEVMKNRNDIIGYAAGLAVQE